MRNRVGDLQILNGPPPSEMEADETSEAYGASPTPARSTPSGGGGGGSVITSNLVLHLDAGDVASYPGSGTAWSDLTSNNHDFTFASPPAYTASPGYFNLASNQATNSDTISITRGAVEMWIKWDPAAVSTRPLVVSDGSNWFAIGNTTGTLPNESMEYYTGVSAAMDYLNGHLLLKTGDWFQLVAVIDGVANTLYLDGAAVTTYFRAGNASSTGLWSGSAARVGTSVGTHYYDGDIAILRIYDVASFTAADVLQNWEAQRARFGK
jgi:hypothetical protein